MKEEVWKICWLMTPTYPGWKLVFATSTTTTHSSRLMEKYEVRKVFFWESCLFLCLFPPANTPKDFSNWYCSHNVREMRIIEIFLDFSWSNKCLISISVVNWGLMATARFWTGPGPQTIQHIKVMNKSWTSDNPTHQDSAQVLDLILVNTEMFRTGSGPQTSKHRKVLNRILTSNYPISLISDYTTKQGIEQVLDLRLHTQQGI